MVAPVLPTGDTILSGTVLRTGALLFGTRRACTTRRWRAEKRGLQVVSVSSASAVGATTLTSWGDTICCEVMRYVNVPYVVWTMMSSPGTSSFRL